MASLTLTANIHKKTLSEMLSTEGIADEKVLDAFARVPRADFLGSGIRHRAIENTSLPIGLGQTTSQPWVIARMLELARNGRTLGKVLEIGAGCGYQTAMLSLLAKEVYASERLQHLAVRARSLLRSLGHRNIKLAHSDGKLGMPVFAKFDAIIVCAATTKVPPALLDQLADGGRLVLPLRLKSKMEIIAVYEKNGDAEPVRTYHEQVVFVPLLGGTK